MIRPPPRATPTDTLFPDTTPFRSQLKYYDAIADCFRDYWARVNQLAAGADILEYGCAYGDNAMRLAATARTATGIDISDVAIERGRAWARQKGLAKDRKSTRLNSSH